MDSATYRHIMGEFTKSCTIPHNYFPCHNLVSLETFLKVSKDNPDDMHDNNDSLAEIPCYKPFKYGVQVSTAFYCGSGVTDLAHNLVKMKLNWEKSLREIKVLNIRKAVKCIRQMKLGKPVKLSKNLNRYINHFEKDPEPGFQGNYNWLYSGGNLSSVIVNDESFLIGADYNKLTLNILKLNKNLDKVECNLKYKLKTQFPILQVSCKSKQDDLLVCARQKNCVTLFRNSDSSLPIYPEKLLKKKVTSTKLITCADLSSGCDEVLVTDTSNDVHVYNIETKKKIYGYVKRKLKDKDNWHEATFGEFGIYLADRKYLYILDTRDEYQEPKLLYSPLHVTNNCEEICSILKSDCDSNYLYLGTTHNCVQLDVRNGKPVQRWTHLMNNPPQFAKCVKTNDGDFIVLQSQKVEETVGITNEYISDGEDAHFFSTSLPCVLPGVKESLKLARFNGLCLYPSIARRFDFAVTGVQCMENPKGDIHLFIENSAGDIYLSKIREKSCNELSTDECKHQILNSMETYEDYYESFVPKEPDKKLLESIYLKHLLEDMRNKRSRPRKYHESDLCWKYHEMFAPESLEMYKDLLAQKILKVWGYESVVDDLNDSTMSSMAKVQEWIEKL